MPQLTPITKQNHTGKSWTKFTSYQFASKDNLVPLAGAEISKAVTSLPIAYAQLLSMGNIQVFEKLAKAHEQMKKPGPDIQPILGDDDIISFQ